ncbi:hypothetical protein [Paenibacillus contaminans]|uniref:Uncharacterized protein n=1 Tax=Paenibacillus contaminans TaxID=450362 RepID=A0A329LY87_9BACL|nr:hypothetical protein [Paenibacillus contaminans]RAV11473.1 hypothetical protein DQG23_36110 [Paenibacillus contaminans]
MANHQLHAFERNRYYTGKLMTVRDFQTEQHYLNEKRHLLNRFIHGSGVVYGLQVELLPGSTDKRGILIRAGVGIDSCGREIVVSRDYNQLADIRDMDGYPVEIDGETTVYLLLSYEECARERKHVHATAGCCDPCEANKILEGFNVKLTTTAPVPKAELCSLMIDTKVVFQNDSVVIERTAPLYVKPGDIFEIVLSVTVKQTISGILTYEITEQLPSSFTVIHSDSLRFQLDNAVKNTKVEKKYTVRAGSKPGSGSIRLLIYEQDPADQTASTVEILPAASYYQRMIEGYLAQLSGDDSHDQKPSGIVLAALQLSAAGAIKKIDSGSRSYVYSNPYLAQLLGCEGRGFDHLPPHALTHQAGGSDPIDVGGLSGLLSDPQKVSIHYDNDKQLTQATGIVFGDGLSVQEADGMVLVRAAMQVYSGTVVISHSRRGAVFLSDMIDIDLPEGTLFSYGLETENELTPANPSEITVNAIYFKEEKKLRFRMTDNRAAREPASFALKWWAIPKTQDFGTVNSRIQ